jgi:hypothetical protein
MPVFATLLRNRHFYLERRDCRAVVASAKAQNILVICLAAALELSPFAAAETQYAAPSCAYFAPLIFGYR